MVFEISLSNLRAFFGMFVYRLKDGWCRQLKICYVLMSIKICADCARLL